MSNATPTIPAISAGSVTTTSFDETELARICQVLEIKTRRSLEAASSELERELQVRERCYKGWVADGKLSRIDATDRFNRLTVATLIFKKLLDMWPDPEDSEDKDGTVPF